MRLQKGILHFPVLALLITTASCFPEHKCDYTNGVNVFSPDRKHVAEVQSFACKPEKSKTLSKHVFIIEFPVTGTSKSSEEVFSIKGDSKVKVVWRDSGNLQVECIGCNLQLIETRKEKFQDVNISYSF